MQRMCYKNLVRGMKTSHRNYSDIMKGRTRELRRTQTVAEKQLWLYVRNQQLGHKFRRQHSIDNKYIADFICLEKRLIVELDGASHTGLHAERKDLIRTEYLNAQDFTILRFTDEQVMLDINTVINRIKYYLQIL